MIGVMQSEGHPVHGNDLKRPAFNLKVKIAISGRIHKTPKLALARSDFNLRAHGTVQREDFIWRLWLCTTNIRTKINAMLQISRLRIIRNGTAAHNQHAL